MLHSRRTPACAAEGLEGRRLLSAGALDPTFGTGGRVVRVADGGGTDVLVQPDDKVLVCGSGFGSLGSFGDFVVYRLNRDGSPDLTFGQQGRVLTDFGHFGNATPGAMALQPDGKILVAGNTGGNSLGVARLLPNGAPDVSFAGGAGIAEFAAVFNPLVTDMALAPDGKVVIVGEVGDLEIGDSFIARLTPAGALDTTFSGDGLLVENLGSADAHTGAAIDAGGRIVTAGHAGGQFGGTADLVLSRYQANGAPDPSFASGGRGRMPNILQAGGVAIDRAGGVLVAFTDDFPQRNLLARFTPAGAQDFGFGANGIAPAGSYTPYYEPLKPGPDLALQYDGDIVVSGTAVVAAATSPRRMAVARLKSTGRYDFAFGSGGTSVLRANDPVADEWATALAVGPDGGVYVSGPFDDPDLGDIAVVSVDPGPVDAPFVFTNGTLVVTGTSGDDTASVTRDNSTGPVTVTLNSLSRTFAANTLNFVRFDLRSGRDTLALGPSLQVDVSFDGGAGDDAVTVDGSAFADTYQFRDDRVTVSGDTLYLVGTESLTVRGNGGGDDIRATFFNAAGDTRPTALTLEGGDGNDLLEGTIIGGVVLHGGAGNDTIRSRNQRADTIDGGAGTDSAGTDPADSVTGVETLLNSVITGAAFSDADGDGAPDPNEVGVSVARVFVDLDNDNVQDFNEPYSSVTTNNSSTGTNYTIDYLAAGMYTVRVVLPTTGGWQFTNPATGSRSITLAVGQQVTSNFAYRQASPTGSISGTLFNDVNGNGRKDAGEVGIAGRTVFNDSDVDGVKDAGEPSVVTDAAGAYAFSNLHAALYRLYQVLPSGWRQTPFGPGPIGISLAPAEAETGRNFGSSDKSGINGRVFDDRDGNGVSGGDVYLGGVTVYIDADGNSRLDAGERSTVTDAGGNYFLAPLEPGTYAVRQQLLTDLPYLQTAPAGNGARAVTVGRAEAVSNIEFGQTVPVTIAGTLIHDADGNGFGGDPLAGWTVYRDLDGDSTLDPGEPTRVTAPDGSWAFNDLVPGTIVLRPALPAGWEVTHDVRFTLPSRAGASDNIAVRRLPGVGGRYVFYDHSAYDAFTAGPGPDDDRAIATDKQALRPGQQATFANVTSYAAGINGIAVDLASPGVNLSTLDFEFKVGAGGDPSSWAPAPEPVRFSVRYGVAGDGFDRIMIYWPDGAIRNRWLQVKVLPTPRTRLTAPDVFYFGNLVGETGAAVGTSLSLNALDTLRTRAALSLRRPVPVTSVFDFNRDGRVDVRDLALARARRQTVLQLIAV